MRLAGRVNKRVDSLTVLTAVGRHDPFLTTTADTVARFCAEISARTEWVLACDGIDHEWVEWLLKEYSDLSIRVLASESPEQVGPARTRNRALIAAQGSVVSTIDSDDAYLPAIAEMWERFTVSGLTWAAGTTEDIDTDGETIWIGPHIALNTGPQSKDVFLTYAQQHGYFPWHCCATLARTKALTSAGSWDESEAFFQGEDVALWTRLSHRFTGFWFGEPVLSYRQHNRSLTKSYLWGNPTEKIIELLTAEHIAAVPTIQTKRF